MKNPILQTWETPFNLPPYHLIEDADFSPALDEALAIARAELLEITTSDAPVTFTNVIAALDCLGEDLSRVTACFYSLLGPCSTPAREKLAIEFGQKLAIFDSELRSNPVLFAHIGALWSQRQDLDLDPEEMRLLQVTRDRFIRGGANLVGEASDRLAEIMAELAELGTKFTQTVLRAEADWSMPLSDETLGHLPEFLRQACIAAGEERGEGPVVTLSRSIIVPFLQFSPDRDLRKHAYDAWTARGAGVGEEDNRRRATRILALRHERAALLGYDNFAQYKLEAQMAKTPGAVRDLLMQVWTPARAAAQQDEKILAEMLASDGIKGDLQPWDWRYYAELRRRKEFDLDEAEVKPYFQLDRMIAAAFDCASRLYGLEFREVEVPTWHEDCRAWDVTRDGKHMAVFIADYFARANKRSGAWCSAILGQRQVPEPRRPQVINICNFAKSDPALLSFDDARTLFHEFGHALHYILTDTRFGSLSGLQVERDFVELPSQLFEHWLSTPEVLDRFATHKDTGAPMPDALRDRLLAASNYDAGFATVEYLASAIVDLELHDAAPPLDVMQRQAEILDQINMPAVIGMRHATPGFMHIFSSDGYSAGYYSYMWSEVMDADAFDAFTEGQGPFDTELAAKLEREILSRGHTRPASEHYTAFRGRMPGVEPLLRGRGLLD